MEGSFEVKRGLPPGLLLCVVGNFQIDSIAEIASEMVSGYVSVVAVTENGRRTAVLFLAVGYVDSQQWAGLIIK